MDHVFISICACARDYVCVCVCVCFVLLLRKYLCLSVCLSMGLSIYACDMTRSNMIRGERTRVDVVEKLTGEKQKTDQPKDQPTDGRAHQVIGKFHIQTNKSI